MASSLNIVIYYIYFLTLKTAYVMCWFVIRRKHSEANRDRPRRPRVELDELRNDSRDLTASTSNLAYQNVAQLQQPEEGNIYCIKE